MEIHRVPHRFLRALTRPLSAQEATDRENARTQLIFASVVVIVLTAPLLNPAHVNAPAFWAALLAIVATGFASMVPACWPILNRVGGLLVAAEVAAVVASTGGATSPYDVLYAILLIYGTIFYDRRRLAATAVVLMLLFAAPHILSIGRHSVDHWARMLVQLGVWSVIAVVAHGLVASIREQRRQLGHQALHDPLTELANRSLFEDRLDLALRNSGRTGNPVALLMVDLDGFKPVNDTHGHHAGDTLLVEIAKRMDACSRPGDTLARLGGDEFALVLPSTVQGAAVQVAKRLIDQVSLPVRIDESHVCVGASVGIAVSSGTAPGAHQLLRQADMAMYAAKRHGRGRAVVFTPRLDTGKRGLRRKGPRR